LQQDAFTASAVVAYLLRWAWKKLLGCLHATAAPNTLLAFLQPIGSACKGVMSAYCSLPNKADLAYFDIVE